MPGGYDSGGSRHTTSTTRRAANYNGDDVMAQIPLLGGWSGARGREQAEQDARFAKVVATMEQQPLKHDPPGR